MMGSHCDGMMRSICWCLLACYRLWRHSCTVLSMTRGYVRLNLSPTSGRCPWWLIFFKNLFYQKNCKEAMNIGGGQIRDPLYNFVVKKCPFLHLPDAALSFYNNPWRPIDFLEVWEEQHKYTYSQIHYTISGIVPVTTSNELWDDIFTSIHMDTKFTFRLCWDKYHQDLGRIRFLIQCSANRLLLLRSWKMVGIPFCVASSSINVFNKTRRVYKTICTICIYYVYYLFSATLVPKCIE